MLSTMPLILRAITRQQGVPFGCITESIVSGEEEVKFDSVLNLVFIVTLEEGTVTAPINLSLRGPPERAAF